MIEAVFVGTLAPLCFLLIILKEDNRRLILFFLWGLAAALAAYYLNGFLQGALGLGLRETSIQLAPFTEESLKALPLLYYLFSKKRERSYEVVRNALAIGIGFSILENIAYLTVLAPEGLRSAMGFAVLRSASACLLHGSAVALVGYTIRQARLYRIHSPELILGALFCAVLSHGLFNYLAGIASAWPLCVLIPALLFSIEILAWNFFGKKPSALPAAIAERTEA